MLTHHNWENRVYVSWQFDDSFDSEAEFYSVVGSIAISEKDPKDSTFSGPWDGIANQIELQAKWDLARSKRGR